MMMCFCSLFVFNVDRVLISFVLFSLLVFSCRMNSIYVTPIPSIVFIHSAVNFRVFLVDQSSSPIQTYCFNQIVISSNEKFAVTLLYEDGTPVKEPSSAMVFFVFLCLFQLLNGLNGNGLIPNNVSTVLVMSQLSYCHKNQKFKLMVETTLDQSIKTVYTNPFLVVFVFCSISIVEITKSEFGIQFPKNGTRTRVGKRIAFCCNSS